MDILDFAMKMEKDGEEYFLDQAGKVEDKNAARIFTLLAREEQKHYVVFKKYKEGISEKLDSDFVKDVKTIFQTMKEKNESFIKKDDRIIEALLHGLEIENKSIGYYVQKMNETDDLKLQQILLILKREEDKHYSLLSSMIDYYMKPQIWIEQAEFSHLDHY